MELEQARQLAQLPPVPTAPRSDRSAWGAVFRGPAAGATELVADVASLPDAMDSPQRVAERHISWLPDWLQDVPDERLHAGARNAQVADQIRGAALSLRPDPATASAAEKVVFGATKGITKGGLAVATLGPYAGAAAFGGSEAVGTYGDLTREGVDSSTAGKAAAVSGVAGAASLLLPMVGSTIPRTLGLYLAGGPGGFVAQQAATRAILEGADYHELAKQYDPLDPVGLTLASLVPLPFAAYGVGRAMRARTTQGEIDAAMTHNLTTQQDAAAVNLQGRIDTALGEQPAYVRGGAQGDPLAGDAMLTQRFVDEVNGVPPEERSPTRQAPPAGPEPQLPGSESAPAPKTAADDVKAVMQRVAALEKESPELATHMETARRAIAEDLGNGVGADDVPLLRVAAECALAMGRA